MTSILPAASGANFGDDSAFLNKHTHVIILSAKSGVAKVALAPAWQGRVMTSRAVCIDILDFSVRVLVTTRTVALPA